MTDKRPRTTSMNKTDLMLLEKQLAFRMVKDRQRPSTGSLSVRSPTKNSFSQGSRDNNNSFSLPNINIPSPSSSSSQSPHKLSTMIDQELISTLSTKPVSLRRKVLTKLMKKKKNPAFDRYKYYDLNFCDTNSSHVSPSSSSHQSDHPHIHILHLLPVNRQYYLNYCDTCSHLLTSPLLHTFTPVNRIYCL